MDDLRKCMLLKRKNMEPALREKSNKDIFENIDRHPYFDEASRIFIYINTKNEAETVGIINLAFEKGKKIFVPVTLKDRMYFAQINTLSGLKKTKMGILEPDSTIEEEPEKGDLFIIPGSVFDENGHRYGYGGGYYDKYLSLCSEVIKVGLCYDFQLLEFIDKKEHDIDMDIIITDKRIVYPKGGGL